ncbi:MAG: PQQ-dependent sugar dehydrogenase [Desulfobulbaceae bacterium]|nr:PQQ-dependent sugar dehydrogenase [Desulfobulbaceae bacterium]MDY0350448.1 PQQ-dependent sugar dehydrogenase [Desulfobulbaceae bacterium]
MKRKRARVLSMICAAMFVAALVHCGCVRPTLADDGELEVRRTVVMSGLDNPWDLAFAPDGAMLFTEKCRGLSVRTVDGTVRLLFGTAGAALKAGDFFCQGQSGMLGVALDPAFAENRRVYVYMASDAGEGKTNRVVRLTVDDAYTGVADRQDIIDDIPFKRSFNRWGRSGAHSGGRIRFSPFDGYLYVTTGDNHNGPLPQDLSRLGGKVLRIDQDGKAAAGNNTPPGGDPRIYTYGHRNVQGIAFHPGTGRPFACEHGPGHNDEVTPLAAGGNCGWDPAPTKGVSCASDYCGYTSNKPDGTPTPMTDLDRFPDALKPSWNNRGISEGMSPCVFLSGPRWKAWEGWLAVGFLRGARIELLRIDADGMTAETAIVADLPAERMRSLVPGPDGALYVATDAGEIWRLERAGQ